MLEAVLVNYPKFLRESRLNIKEKNMSVVSAPLKNDIAMQKDLFRLAASIYSESSDVVSDSEIQTQIVRCMFVAKENEYLTKSEIISNLLDIYKYHISEDEVDAVIRQSRGVFQSVLIDECRAYCLTSQAYTESVEMQKNSFINIRPKSKQISPENANIILSGISSITEDIKTQEHLVAAVYSDEFQNVIKNSSSDMDLYEKVQRITQNYLDEELRKKEDQIQSLQTDVSQRGAEVEAMQERFEEQSHALEDSKRQIENQTEELKKKQEQIINLATSKIMAKYIWINYVLPILLALLVVFLVIFIGLQFICKDKEWNFAILFYEWIRSTYFGMCVGDFVYAIDGVFAGIVGYFLKKWMRNPFNATKKKKSKMDLVQKYIDDHQLN